MNNCEHKTIHTELVNWVEPDTDMHFYQTYIDTYCADCGERLKRVEVKANT